MSTQSSEEDLPPFPDPEVSSIVLENKPGAKIRYTYYQASKPTPNHPNPFSQSLVVFLNGLALPRSSWDASIQSFLEKRINARLPYPALLSYDRYGQGESDHDPDDADPPPSHSHDCMSAVHDLRRLTTQIWETHQDTSSGSSSSPSPPTLLFVGNSIGCALARLFAHTFPGTVAGLLFLDSIMANSDNVSLWPDPSAPGFDPHTLPPGVSEHDVLATRATWHKALHPSLPNREGLSRLNLSALLPEASGPKLRGSDGAAGGPYVTVVGHDWEEFAEQCAAGILQTPKVLTMTYANPAWQRYNEGLVGITDAERAIGPLIAVGCGHFVQKDSPGFVSDELIALLDRVCNRMEQVRERD